MKTIGQIIGDARSEKKLSFDELGDMTKIKSSFIEALEKEDWNSLPPFPTVLGFAKSLASVLGLEEKTVVAVLKRDYPPKKLSINPKPDISDKKSFGPRIAFYLGVGMVTLLILGYLTFTYVNFISPPKINVISPIEGQSISSNTVLVFGSTDNDAKVTVNNEPVLLDEEGKFSVNIEISKDTSEINIKATSRSGKETTIIRKIKVQSN